MRGDLLPSGSFDAMPKDVGHVLESVPLGKATIYERSQIYIPRWESASVTPTNENRCLLLPLYQINGYLLPASKSHALFIRLDHDFLHVVRRSYCSPAMSRNSRRRREKPGRDFPYPGQEDMTA
ncbi:hypothetical protein CAL28_20100 [Bordetella genomosp. 11]|uniref:Uncharacterized protein n=1 Tax=Bordetella genomosp. 11 TaxID=1416808 RepID=A0A261UJ56_9BORD|nr:hypothetical protein CAL28_20100 [Bordetella genomosp. 11]